ncbi:phage tail tape measure protein [uncultured Parabacteroides sp.]|jgi:TP901 family phage tail tape measure protein|uniref:phage tail tape measure protein n=1 Tax=uncultured Parabacteroides sp. TaxID=512312 RepID=UPI00262C6F6B|nr:phage tail tape measure protein [uncultured Parabacteroides sp.]
MANETKITDIVGKSAIGQLDELNQKLKTVQDTYVEFASKLGNTLNFDPKSLKELNDKYKEYNENIKGLQSSISDYNNIAKKKAEIESMLSEAAKNRAAAEEHSAKAQNERLKTERQIEAQNRKRKATEEELSKIMVTQAKSIAQAEEQNRKLRQAVKDVSDTDANAAKVRAEYNRKIEENTKYIRQNRDSYTQQKMTIGDYKNQILEALKTQGSFTDKVKATMNVLKQQKGSIAVAAAGFAAFKVAGLAISGLSKFMSEAVSKIMAFEKANSVLASILGTTSSEIKELTNDAKRLGESTSATASQVTELQTELAKLGFSRDEILASTEAVLQFSLATGSSLPDAAALAGAALRIFGADADEMDRYVSAMAVSTNKSALSFSKLATAIPIVAPVARAFGFEIEDVLTLLGKLSDAGFDASSAATATRNIFLNLADSGGKLAKALGRPVKNIKELQDGLLELNERGIDLAEMLELTDKRSVAAFATFVKGAGDLDKFKDSITDVNEEMRKSAEERVNNLAGSVTKLGSAWEGLMLTFSEGAGVLKSIVDWLTSIVGKINELVSSSEQLSEKRIAQAKREAIEYAKTHKIEEEYFRDIQGFKDGYIKQGLNEIDAERKAKDAVVNILKQKYESQTKLLDEYDRKKKEIEESSSGPSAALLNYQVEEQQKEAIKLAEQYAYILKKIQNQSLEDDNVSKTSGSPTEKEIKEAEKAAKERLRIEQDLHESIIGVEKDGYKKEQMLLTFNYQKRIDAIKGNSKEEIETRNNLRIQMSNALLQLDMKRTKEIQEKELTYQLSIVEKGSEEELALKLEYLKLQEEKELDSLEKQVNNVEEFEKLKSLVIDKYNKQRLDKMNQYDKSFLESEYEDDVLNLRKAMNEELNILKDRYSQGLISKEQYEKESAEITERYAIDSAKLQIQMLERVASLLSGDEQTNAYRKLAEAKMKLDNMVADNAVKKNEEAKKSDKERLKDVQEKVATIVSVVNEATNAIGGVLNAMFDRQIQNIDNEIQANQEDYDKKIENIDLLAEKEVITKEEAEARKRTAEEQTSTRNAELEKKKADLQTKQAKFEKSINVAQTIANTAQAVMKTYAQGGFFGGAIAAAIVAAIGAAQLATIIAQPIPKYAKGTDYHPGGLAIVGDAGKHEAIVSGGKAYITPDVPTLMPIPKGAEVLPDITSREFYDRFMDNSYWLTHNNAGEPVNIINNFNAEGIIQANNKTNNDLKKEIRSLGRIISKGQRRAEYNSYKNSKMN